MEIIDERTKNRPKIEDLAVGNLFIDREGDVCMITDEAGTLRDVKCVALRSGIIFEEWKTARVEVVEGKLYIED
jgi:hypothetical protein